MRPALRWAELVRRLFDGTEDVLRLLEEFEPEIVLAPAPHGSAAPAS